MRTASVGVFRVATTGPGDVSGLMAMIGSGAISARQACPASA